MLGVDGAEGKGRYASVREGLLKAAERLFNHDGIHGTSVDTIASEVEAAKMSLYHEFESKLNRSGAC
jgi:AcrR family transcriptional regulator